MERRKIGHGVGLLTPPTGRYKSPITNHESRIRRPEAGLLHGQGISVSTEHCLRAAKHLVDGCSGEDALRPRQERVRVGAHHARAIRCERGSAEFPL